MISLEMKLPVSVVDQEGGGTNLICGMNLDTLVRYRKHLGVPGAMDRTADSWKALLFA
jgi:hypothetical protein